jgi:protein tyrosine phosphatase (PTP) superfamily phosphohydrolase (DUF442 family)
MAAIDKPLRPSLRTAGRRFLLASLLPVLAAASFVFYEVKHNNFHVVSAGRVYRSAQMDAGDLTRAIRDYGIKSVLNLRGQNANQEWYRAETDTTLRLGVEHLDFGLSAGREVGDAEMDLILSAIDRAPKPLLVHCKSGADRTGLVGALYLYGIEGKSAETADRELTVFCGHFPLLFWRDTIAMDRSFRRYVSRHVPRQRVLAPANRESAGTNIRASIP